MKLCEYRPIGGADRYPEDNANSMLEIHYCGAVGLNWNRKAPGAQPHHISAPEAFIGTLVQKDQCPDVPGCKKKFCLIEQQQDPT
jgi:hypothetical protein